MHRKMTALQGRSDGLLTVKKNETVASPRPHISDLKLCT